jgi:hypothetical protein
VPACPQGHDSADPDWCDVCGLAMAGPSSAPSPSPPPDCVVCGAPLSGRFCERCGYDSDAPARATWQAVVRADPAWFEEVRRRNGADAAALEFPRHTVDRCYPLSGERVAIGRHSRSRGTTPEIDLADLDPGVSAVHAVLVGRPDGGWDLVDLGSTNGTTLAGADAPIAAHVPVPLADGSVVRLGAWTTITVSVDQSR